MKSGSDAEEGLPSAASGGKAMGSLRGGLVSRFQNPTAGLNVPGRSCALGRLAAYDARYESHFYGKMASGINERNQADLRVLATYLIWVLTKFPLQSPVHPHACAYEDSVGCT